VDPDSMGSLDSYPDTDSQFGYGSRRAKIAQKNRKVKKISSFEVVDVIS
jgi:hypothetical protein